MSNLLTTVLLEPSTVPGTEQAFNKCFRIMNEVKVTAMQKWEAEEDTLWNKWICSKSGPLSRWLLGHQAWGFLNFWNAETKNNLTNRHSFSRKLKLMLGKKLSPRERYHNLHHWLVNHTAWETVEQSESHVSWKVAWSRYCFLIFLRSILFLIRANSCT